MFYVGQKVVYLGSDSRSVKQYSVDTIVSLWNCNCGILCIERADIRKLALNSGYVRTVCEDCEAKAEGHIYLASKFFAPLEEWEIAEELVQELVEPEKVLI